MAGREPQPAAVFHRAISIGILLSATAALGLLLSRSGPLPTTVPETVLTAAGVSTQFRVAVYQGGGAHKLPSQSIPGAILVSLNQTTIADSLSSTPGFDLLWVNEGSASRMSTSLGASGRAAIVQFVAQGGGYLGFSAGGALAIQDLGISAYQTRPASPQRDEGKVRLRLSATEFQISQENAQHLENTSLTYTNGPVMQLPASPFGIEIPAAVRTPIVTVAYYATSVPIKDPLSHLQKEDKYVRYADASPDLGSAAVVFNGYQFGRVMLFGPSAGLDGSESSAGAHVIKFGMARVARKRKEYSKENGGVRSARMRHLDQIGEEADGTSDVDEVKASMRYRIAYRHEHSAGTRCFSGGSFRMAWAVFGAWVLWWGGGLGSS